MTVRVSLLSTLFLLLSLWWPQPIYAQSGQTGQIATTATTVDNAVRISCVNVRNAPVIELCLEDNPFDNINLSARPLTLLEDGLPQTITDDRYEEAGLQIAIGIDPNNLLALGEAGPTRLIAGIRQLSRGFWRFDTDFLTVGTLDGAGAGRTVVGWGWDVNNALNLLRQEYELAGPVMAAGTPSLFRLINYQLDQFAIDIPDIRPGAQRALVVFSTGQDLLDERDVQAIAERAGALQVNIYPVLVGADRGQNRENLVRLAAAANGQFTHLQTAEDLERVWGRLAVQRTKRMIRYVTASAQPQTLNVTIPVESGQATAGATIPSFVLPSFTLAVSNLVNNQAVTLTDTLTEIPVLVQFTWPEGRTRPLQSLICTLTGPTGPLLADRVEGNQCVFTVARADGAFLPPGNYLIEANATDAYGIGATAPLVSFTLASSATSGTQPAPTTTPVVTGPPTAGSGLLAYLSSVATQIPLSQAMWLVVGFIAAVGTAFGVRKWRQVRSIPPTRVTPATPAPIAAPQNVVTVATPATAVATVDEEAETEPYNESGFAEPDEDTGDTQPLQLPDFYIPAWLVHVEGGSNPPPRLPLHAFSEHIIGRSAKLCDLVIDETAVSRKHCTLISEDNETWCLQDEGSAGGTFINRRKLGPKDRLPLNDGDEINFNIIRYRFERNQAAAATEANGHVMSN